MVDVWRIKLDRSPSEVTALHGLLDPSERSRATLFRAERDRTRFVVAHATLRMVLAEYDGGDPQSLNLIVRRGGKPVVAGSGVSALHFNLSHSGDLALVAVADREVGVDVEQVDDHYDFQRVAQHFFSETEARMLAALSGTDRTHFFFRTWVRKEAYLKASGEGIARDTTRFTVHELMPAVALQSSDDGRPADSYDVYDLPDIENHFAAVALASVGSAPAIRFREWQTYDEAPTT